MMPKETIMAILWENNLDIPQEYLPSEFFEKFEYVFDLCRFIDSGWALATPKSQEIIDYCWIHLCDYREIDPLKEYKDMEDFMRGQVL